MPVMETVTIINKSGKVVSTGKQLVNIFKDAKEAYTEKKAALKADHHARIEFRAAQKLLEQQAHEPAPSVASSRHSHRSRSHRHRDNTRPPLTERALSQIEEGSVTSSRRSRSHHGSHRPRSSAGYRSPYMENDSTPALTRRHTDSPRGNMEVASRRGHPSPYARSHSNPDFHNDNIDMNLAYGTPPPEFQLARRDSDIARDKEVKETMTRLDSLLMEAHCVQHSATAIITNLQSNPEAMAAVALTLAELSNLLTKASPALLAGLKSSSPAVFALLASPQFLIAGGLAIGVTVVMFGGYKIVKKIQADTAAKKEANRMEEALVWDAHEMGSIESWRRGIDAADGLGVDAASATGTSVEGEFITPEAARQKKERIKERRREERREGTVGRSRSERGGSVAGESVRSERTIRQSDIPIRSTVAPSESGRSERTVKTSRSSRDKDGKKEKKESSKKNSALAIIFKKSKDKERAKEASVAGSSVSKSHAVRSRVVEL